MDQKLTTKKAQVLHLNTFPPNAKNGSLSFGCLQSVYSRFNTFSPSGKDFYFQKRLILFSYFKNIVKNMHADTS